MNTLKTDKARPMLADQVRWFLLAIAVSAWRWRKPLFPGLIETQRIADEEETRILIDAFIYGILTPAFVEPVKIDFIEIFDVFFADADRAKKDSVHLAEILAEAFGKAVNA